MFEEDPQYLPHPGPAQAGVVHAGILAIYRLGSQIPTPGVNLKLLAQFFDQQAGSALAWSTCSAAETCAA